MKDVLAAAKSAGGGTMTSELPDWAPVLHNAMEALEDYVNPDLENTIKNSAFATRKLQLLIRYII